MYNQNSIILFNTILNNPKKLKSLPLNLISDIDFIEKYNNNFLEFLYIIWGDELENYIPYEMFEELKNEKLMKEYHQSHEEEQENWAKEVNQKIKLLSK